MTRSERRPLPLALSLSEATATGGGFFVRECKQKSSGIRNKPYSGKTQHCLGLQTQPYAASAHMPPRCCQQENFMKARTALLTLIVLLIVFLATMNWQVLGQPNAISLGFTEVQAPLGLIMLCLTSLLAVFFVAYVLALQGSVLMETRRHNKEMLAQRELADKAEASRFTELRTVLELRHQEAQQQLLQRMDALEEQFKARAQESDNSTAAYVGQLEQQLRSQGGAKSGATGA